MQSPEKNIEQLETQRKPATHLGTLLEVLKFRNEHNRDDLCYRILEAKQEPYLLSYGELHDRAHQYAGSLRTRGVKPGDKVLIMLPTGTEFFFTFFGIQLCGAVPVPVYPPFRLGHLDDYVDRLAALVRNAEAVGVVTFKKIRMIANLVKRQTQVRFLATIEQINQESDAIVDPWHARPQDPALIQYTSGSTGSQKGVVLAHSNIIHNMTAIGTATAFAPETDVCVSWLPLYHDMGLIGTVLNSMLWGMPCVVIPPQDFVRRPSRWLRAFSDYRGTLSPAPNFAYNLCVKKCRPKELEGLDLSSWRVAYCGAEPIHRETIESFTERFGAYGFAPESFYPVYGLAENSLAVTFPKLGERPCIDIVEEVIDDEGQKSFPAVGPNARPQRVKEWISVGYPLPDHEVKIVDRKHKELPARVEGEVIIRSPSVMQEYYKNPEATAKTLIDGWLHTRDLGYMSDGRLYVTGRLKDMIIKGGRNFYPQDIEGAAAAVKGVRTGCVAAFGVYNKARATEDIVCAAETRISDEKDKRELDFALKAHVAKIVGCKLDHLVLCPPGTLPKTSSGKIQRYMARERYLSGSLGRTGWVGWQVGKAYVKSLVRKIGRLTGSK